MEVNDERLGDKRTEAADVPIDIPVEQIKEAAQQTSTLDDTKVKRKRGRPRKPTYFNFMSKPTCPSIQFRKRRRVSQVAAPVEMWTPSRLRKEREWKMKKIIEELNRPDYAPGKGSKRKCKRKAEATAEEICFVNIKEEQPIVDTNVKSEQNAYIHPKIEEHEKWHVHLKEVHRVIETSEICEQVWDKENQQIVGIDGNMKANVLIIRNSSLLDHLPCQVLREGKSSESLVTDPNNFGNESETTIDLLDLDTQLNAFDVLCNLIYLRSEKPNSHHSQQHHQLQRFLRPSDYILSIVAWHKLNGRNYDGIDESYI